MNTPSYVVITPVRNEEDNFGRTIQSFVRQTLPPRCWIIVDDGSTDATGAIADAAAIEHAWIRVVHRRNRGFRQPGTGVIEAFYDGLALLGSTPWEFLVKFDGDLAFSPDYFARCVEEFTRDPKLGVGGGLICREEGGDLISEVRGDPPFHVRGATKIYRRACWDEIGGLVRAPGWDAIDELKANMLGWSTRTFSDLKVHQLKDTGSADGSWRNWVKNGLANYITGYHPVFMIAKCGCRLARRPFSIEPWGLFAGFLKGYLQRVPRVQDRTLIAYISKQQINRLIGRGSLWQRSG